MNQPILSVSSKPLCCTPERLAFLAQRFGGHSDPDYNP